MIATTPRKRSPNQDVRTPRDLLDAVEAWLGPVSFDLAAAGVEVSVGRDTDQGNWGGFFSPEVDSLKQDWTKLRGKLLWLNPPFSDIRPWAEKCHEWAKHTSDADRQVLALLVPGSVDSNWWDDHVRHWARSYALAPRVKFVGHDQPFPKAMTLNLYRSGLGGDDRVRLWRWK